MYPIRLMRASRVRIIRYVKIRGDANPYDPKWEGYLDGRLFRRMNMTLGGRTQIRYLWKQQQGRCKDCGQLLREDEPWQVHHRTRRTHGGGDELANLQLLHANCHRQRHSKESGMELDCVSQEAFRRLKPDALQSARPVLRGGEAGNRLS